MLPKSNRILRSEFENIIKNGKRLHSPIFILYINKPKNPNSKKFAFSVSKKVCKGAVGRNKLRRQGYSVVQKQIKNIKEGYLFVFVYKKTIKTPNYQEIEENINSLLREFFMLI